MRGSRQREDDYFSEQSENAIEAKPGLEDSHSLLQYFPCQRHPANDSSMLNEPEELFDFDPKIVRNENIIVRNFHAWLKNDLKIREQQLTDIIDKIERKEVILPTYNAILIDEGHDFEADWLRLVSLLINEDTQSLLFVEDRAQTIYKRKRSYLQDTGRSFQCRSKVLSINYRNTQQIVKFA